MFNNLKKIAKKNKLFRNAVRINNICVDSSVSLKQYFGLKKRCFLFMTPSHNNAGDIAQTVCINDWIHNNYPGYTVINIVQVAPGDRETLEDICRGVRLDDKIFIHSGFNITDVGYKNNFPEVIYESHKVILSNLKDHQIVFFPQTVQFETTVAMNKMSQLYELYDNIVFLSRDFISYECAKKLLPKARVINYPDIVTSWIGKYEFNSEPLGINACMRFGPESLLSKNQKHDLMDGLNRIAKTTQTDTNFKMNRNEMRRHRKDVVLNMIQHFSKYEVVVTDRYHGVIFSLIAGRPVVVLPTFGHKVTSGLAWFPEEHKEYVIYVKDYENVEEIVHIVKEVYDRKLRGKLPSYFKEKYYDHLMDYIEN